MPQQNKWYRMVQYGLTNIDVYDIFKPSLFINEFKMENKHLIYKHLEVSFLEQNICMHNKITKQMKILTHSIYYYYTA